MCDFNVYTGKEHSGTCKNLGAKVVKMSERNVIFDNFFLFDIGCVATLQHALTRRSFHLSLKKLSLERGQYRSKLSGVGT